MDPLLSILILAMFLVVGVAVSCLYREAGR